MKLLEFWISIQCDEIFIRIIVNLWQISNLFGLKQLSSICKRPRQTIYIGDMLNILELTAPLYSGLVNYYLDSTRDMRNAVDNAWISNH